MKISLNQQIFLGVLVGVGLGLLMLFALPPETPAGASLFYLCRLVGSLFINALKMILIPLVFVSICMGIANLRAHAQMDRVWKTALLYFLTTTALSIILGLLVVNLFKPGAGLETAVFETTVSEQPINQLTVPEFIENFLLSLLKNPLEAMAQGDVLPTVIFALILGIALVVAGPKAETIHRFLDELFVIIMMIVNWIMFLAPYGIAGLIAKLVATQDIALLNKLGVFILVVLGATLFHGFVVLPLVLRSLTSIRPARFFQGVREALITAFSTSSSSATLPVTIRCVEDNLGVDKNVAGFVLPLGATINMDGTALYEAVAALFIANLVGVELSLVHQITVFFMAMIAAIGAPGIPSAGMVTMAMVLKSVGLPLEAIAILLPIDRLLDAVRTMVNVEGDAIGSCVVDRLVNRSAPQSP